ncbi:MAG: Eco57I restriction-modification methylase domain-containing protein [Gemmataceae bacterium]|nr:Eco57I restriction-modification methylase domain-containing protein [Gemmataceae bacterium]
MIGHNPDILTCLANLSADEVFTPPKLAVAMLDILPQELFRRPDTTFLDPVCKSGVFLREIARRLNEGLKDQMPDEQSRINHILTKQVFGLATSELTSLLSRRSVYCSKKADGKYSIVTAFNKPDGNIRLPKAGHEWAETKCRICGAPRAIFDREDALESYAYPFIHISTKSVLELFGDNMKFDLIIGNPPYQMAGGAGGTSDSSIYHLFVNQALKLSPRYLMMVIPSRWLAGGRGLDEFRQEMLGTSRLRELIDYPAASDVFPGVEIKAGVCYFLWDSTYQGECKVTTIRGSEILGPISRNLGEYDVFVRDARAVSILQKVVGRKELPINTILTRDTAFGLASNFSSFRETATPGDIALYFIRKMKRGMGYVSRNEITKSEHLIDRWKVLVPEAYNGGDSVPHQILGRPLIAPSPSVCTQSYLVFYVDSKKEAKSLQSYYMTRFFRFLVSQRKITQHALHSTYAWVPIQEWDKLWTDEVLYEKYGITAHEIAFIESMVRPMDGAE